MADLFYSTDDDSRYPNLRLDGSRQQGSGGDEYKKQPGWGPDCRQSYDL